ncbi:TOMM precursor leader peptide-binding protein [Actinokineospora cianjurensis]|uniref:Ribosomal protein S12 methylthiotransferase accessory factor n=1 Tax=Actinokineospora cianjurensis TaxID=585224 RepID=A0A421B591_9PSEU|nr:TOMM precursor leader peptide-binding protein [Actinokineospora cianjurensis]RLK59475.1 ribosomal protein S12 methylthiotransferase accessory factor [Actinokineospora cianjurensis]
MIQDAAAITDYFRDRLVRSEVIAPAIGVLGSPRPSALDEVVPIHLDEGLVVLGPIRAPGGTGPCAECLRLRWEQRAGADQPRESVRIARSPHLTPFMMEAVLQLWLCLRARRPKPGTGTGTAPLYRVDLPSGRVERMALLADPSCSVCGPPAHDPPIDFRLVTREKHAVDTFRASALADVDLPVSALVNSVCGLIGAKVELGLPSPTTAPAFGSFTTQARGGVHDILWMGQTNRFDDSRTAALLEGLERYAGVRHRASSSEIIERLVDVGEPAVDPRDCGLYADGFYHDSGAYKPFDPERPISWVDGHSVRDGRTVLVPRQIAYFGEAATGQVFADGSSNGCAIGANLEEAALHGLLELVERDSALLAWYGGGPLPEIDPASCDDLQIRLTVEQVRLAGFDVRLFDARSDLAIPVVIAVAIRLDGGPGARTFASGADLDPVGAIRSALFEVASYAPDLAGRVLARLPAVERMAADFGNVVDLMDHSLVHGLPAMATHSDFLLAPNRKLPVRELYADVDPRGLDLLDDLDYCIGQVARAGHDVVVVDQTRPEHRAIGLRAVRVVAPGLLPIDFGWRKQRALNMPRLRNALQRTNLARDAPADGEPHRVPHPYG